MATSWLSISVLFCIQYGNSQWTNTGAPKIDIPIATWTVAVKGDTMFAGAYRGTIYRSTDKGIDWIEVRNGLSPSLSEAHSLLIVEDTVFAGTDMGVYRSTDWGAQWTLQSEGLTNVVSLARKDSTLFAVKENGIFESRDWGNRWQMDNAGFPTDVYGNIPSLYSIVIADSLVLVGCRDGVYRKVVGDTLWKSANYGIPFDQHYHVPAICLQAQGGRVFLGSSYCGGSIFFSSNFGDSWTSMTNGMPINLSGCYLGAWSFARKDSCILAGTQYGVYRSLDEGKNWEPLDTGLPLGPASDLYVPSIIVTGTEFLASTFGGIYRLTFGDSAWSPLFVQYSGITHYPVLGGSGVNLFAQAYADYFNGSIDRAFRSTNDGRTWIADTSSTMMHTTHFFNIGKDFYAAGIGLFVSSDDGYHWREIDSGLSLVNALASNGTMMFAGYGAYVLNADNGGVYRSTNYGLGWDPVGLQGFPVRSLAMVGNNVVAHSQGVLMPSSLYRSTDNGSTWLKIDSLLPSGIAVTSLASSEGILFVGTNHGVFSSADVGTSWQRVNNGLSQDSTGSFLSITFLYVNNTIPALMNVLFAAIGQKLFMTGNGGATWQAVDSGLPGNQTQLVSISADTSSLIISTDHDVWRRPLSQLASAISHIVPIPFSFKLQQNYPNPFNPATDFEFRIANFGFVSLKVYDVLGREVATVVDEVKQPGEYSVTWDASKLPSGVYFYRLTAGAYTDTKKLLLLK